MEFEVVHDKTHECCGDDGSCRSAEEDSTTNLQNCDSYISNIL